MNPVARSTWDDQVLRSPLAQQMIDETMTVNRLAQKFPVTRRVFEQLFINVPLEGCTCLDEVAWRHGMEARDLINKLEAVITSCGCRSSEVSQLTTSVCAPEDAGVTA